MVMETSLIRNGWFKECLVRMGVSGVSRSQRVMSVAVG